MSNEGDSSVLPAKRGNLATAVAQQLLARLESGQYAPGEKLASQDALCQEFGVSRTVIREAVASLRQSGHLIVRQGSGVFVSEVRPAGPEFGRFASRDVTTSVHILELRLGVEVEQVALAAERRTPTTLANIIAAYDRFNELDGSDPEAMARADYAFHMAIAQATANPQFVRFLEALGEDIFLDMKLKHDNATTQGALMRIKSVRSEHAAILSAIATGNANDARQAVRRHLEEGLERYRRAVSGEWAKD